MVEVCTWDKAFTSKAHIVLYWYLFNRPDYQLHIAEEFADLRRNSDEFKESIPRSLTCQNNITRYLREMEECNLVGIRNVEGRKHYYQALSFFYLDPFCIKTPRSKKKYVNDHFEEYSEYLRDLNIELPYPLRGKARTIMRKEEFWEWSRLAFKYMGKNNSIIPAQKIFQEYSQEPSEFMEMISYPHVDFISLYGLIEHCFKEIHDLLEFRSAWIDEHEHYLEAIEMEDFEEAKNIEGEFFFSCAPDYRMLAWNKATGILDQDTPSLIERYHVDDWFGKQLDRPLSELCGMLDNEDGYYFDEVNPVEKQCWNVLESHLSSACGTVGDQLGLYQHIKEANILFNRETLLFEGL
jgi:hypothetical protein